MMRSQGALKTPLAGWRTTTIPTTWRLAEAPFYRHEESGFGCEVGSVGIEEYLDVKNVALGRIASGVG
jgi:acyl-CoA reductase-like NAD-dependent aldehyde dehydrogenase